jgi:predicted O-methyltransferase YrrM
MIPVEEAIERAKQAGTMLYNRKANCPDAIREQELRNLYRLATLAPDGPAVEVGTWKGGALVCWAPMREGRGPVFAVDDDSSKVNQICEANIERFGLDVTFLWMDSIEGAKIVPDDLAFCFIDANHAEGIGRDVPVWTKKMAPGGIIIYHDYGTRKCPLVKLAVDAWAAEARWQFIGQCGSSRGYRRPPE